MDSKTETQIIEWISNVTKIKVSKPIIDSLKSGATLCKLINFIKPGTIKKINLGTAVFSHRENISSFTKGCESIGFQEDLSRFQEYILDEKEEGLVISALYNLMKYSEKISNSNSTNGVGGGASSSSASTSSSSSSNNNNNNNNNSSSSGSSSASPLLTPVAPSSASIPSPILKPSHYVAKRMVSTATVTSNNSSSNNSNNNNSSTPTLERKSSGEVVAKPVLSVLSSSSSQLFNNNNNCNNSSNNVSTVSSTTKNNLANKSKFFNSPSKPSTTSISCNNNNNDETPSSPSPSSLSPNNTTPTTTSPRGKREPTTSVSSSPPKKPVVVSVAVASSSATTVASKNEEILNILDNTLATTTLDSTPVTQELNSSTVVVQQQEEIEKESTVVDYDNSTTNNTTVEEVSIQQPTNKPSKPPPPPPRNRNIPLSKQLSSGSMTDDTINSSSDDIQFEFDNSKDNHDIHNNITSSPLSPVSDSEDNHESPVVVSSSTTKTIPISIPPSSVSSTPTPQPPTTTNTTSATTTTNTTTTATPISHSSSSSAHSLTNFAKNKPVNNNNNSNYNTISTSSPTSSNNNNNNILNNPTMFSPPNSPTNYNNTLSTSTSPNGNSSSGSHHSQPQQIKKPRSSTKQKLVGFFGNKNKQTSASTNNLHSLNHSGNGTSSSSSVTSSGGSVLNISHKQSISAGSNNSLSQSMSSSFTKMNGNGSANNGNNRRIGFSSDDDDNNNNVDNNNNNNSSGSLSQSMGSPINNNTNYYYNNNNSNHFLPKNSSSNSLTMSRDSNNNNSQLNNSGNHFEEDGDPDDQLTVNSEELIKALSQTESLFKDRSVVKDRVNFTFPEKFKSLLVCDELFQVDSATTFLTPQLRSLPARKQMELCRTEGRRFLSEIFTLQNVQNIVDENKELKIVVDNYQKMIESLIVEKKSLAAKFDEMLAVKVTSDAKKIEEEGIIFSDYKGKIEIKGGKTEKLIERLYNKNIHGSVSEYVDTFLLTYRAFTSSKNVMEMLTKTYTEHEFIQETSQEPERQFQIEQENAGRKKIRLRICNFLKRWVELFFHDFDQDLIQEYNQFITKSKESSALLQRTLDKKLSGQSNIKAPTFGKLPPVPLIPKLPIGSFNDEVDPIEIARQLTLIDFDLFRSIASKELLSLSWQKSDKEKRSPNLLKMIYRFNEVSNWVTLTIVKETNLKKRAHHLKRFIRLTEELRKLNNFNSIFVVVSALHSASVNRLSKTWGEISKQQQKQFEEFVALTAPNSSFSSYREELHNANPPCIPYLGVHLSDLTFIEEGNPDKLENGFVNFFKCRMVAEVIKEVQQFQQQPYNLTAVNEISGPLTSHKVVSESECFKLSLLAEPRESINN